MNIIPEDSAPINLDDLLDLKKRYDGFVHNAGKKALKAELKQFFKNNPEFLAIRWEQYTPYFNDGSPCVFSVHEPYYKVRMSEPLDADTPVREDDDMNLDTTNMMEGVESDEDGDYDDDNWQDAYGLKASHLRDKATTFTNRLQESSDILEKAFGDGVQITVTPTSITVEEVDSHD